MQCFKSNHQVYQLSSQGKIMANKIGAYNYVECSAKKNKNISSVFEEAIRSVLRPKTKSDKEKKKRRCKIQ